MSFLPLAKIAAGVFTRYPITEFFAWSFQIARKWKVMGEIILLRHNLMFASCGYLSLDLQQVK